MLRHLPRRWISRISQRGDGYDGGNCCYGAALDNVHVVAGNWVPTGISPSSATVGENAPAGTLVAELSASDPDAGDTHTFSLIDDAGGRFLLVGNQLQVAAGASLEFAREPEHVLLVRATDQGELSIEQNLTVKVSDPGGVATQASVDAVEAKLDGLDMSVLNDIDAAVAALEAKLDARARRHHHLSRLAGKRGHRSEHCQHVGYAGQCRRHRHGGHNAGGRSGNTDCRRIRHEKNRIAGHRS